MYQIKAVVRNEKLAHRTVSATEALEKLKEVQSRSGLRSCAAFRKGVLLTQQQLEQAARRDRDWRP